MAETQCCPLETLLKHIAGQWTLYILWILDTNGPQRFGELKRKVEGISTKMLTQRLRLLESLELIHRDHKPTIPPQVTYSLSERGKELSGTLDQLYELAVRWYGADQESAV